MRLLFLSLMLFMSTMLANQESPEEICFLRSPRSGSHWLLYCLVEIADFEVISCNESRIHSIYFPEKEGPKIFSAHHPAALRITQDSFMSNDILILMVRNYRECLIRRYQSFSKVRDELRYESTFCYLDSFPPDLNQIASYHKNNYFHNIRCFENWNPEKRYLIYYEDFIDDPEKVLYEILSFLKIDNINEKLSKFMSDFDFHRNKSLSLYDKAYKSQSKGQDILFHSKQIGYDDSKRIDDLVKALFPYYFQKYLARYELNSE
ncbi:MAG: hypothetical protein K1000chlam3_01447 [Chlamydiae bacterium]|nr:hypothetical protein [Chlamydiota bacterium]